MSRSFECDFATGIENGQLYWRDTAIRGNGAEEKKWKQTVADNGKE